MEINILTAMIELMRYGITRHRPTKRIDDPSEGGYMSTGLAPFEVKDATENTTTKIIGILFKFPGKK